MTKHEAELKQLREALQEADTLMGHDDAETEWREKWAYLWADVATPQPAAEVEDLRRALHEIAEEWAGAECGEPVHAQEAYAIGLAKRMYALAVEGLGHSAELTGRQRLHCAADA